MWRFADKKINSKTPWLLCQRYFLFDLPTSSADKKVGVTKILLPHYLQNKILLF